MIQDTLLTFFQPILPMAGGVVLLCAFGTSSEATLMYYLFLETRVNAESNVPDVPK